MTTFIRDAKSLELLGVSDLPEEARVKGFVFLGCFNALGIEEYYEVLDVRSDTVYIESQERRSGIVYNKCSGVHWY